MAGSVWIWSEGRWRREGATQAAVDQPVEAVGAGGGAGAGKEAERDVRSGAGGGTGIGAQSSVLEAPSSGDAGFVMPGDRSSAPPARRGDVPVSDTSGGAGKPSRPADFWLLRGAARLGEVVPSHRSRRAERRTPDSGGGELPAALRERLGQAGVFVWQAAQPLSQLREYAVPVFHLEALAVERIYRQTERRDEAAARSSGTADGGTRSPIMDSAHAVAREARRAAALLREERAIGSAAALRGEEQTSGAAVGMRREGQTSNAAAAGAVVRAYGDDGDQTADDHEDQPVTYRDPQLKRAARTAIRALYALGLDYGEVRIVLDGEGRAAVRTIMPLAAERLHDAAGRSALRRFAHGYAAARAAHGRESLRIGADPEFVLLRRNGRIVSPARFLDPGDAAGCDTVVVGRRVRHPVAELRPDPAADPGELALHLRRLLRRAAARITEPGLRWLAGGMPVPGLGLGGHIHLSGVWLSSRLLRMLDSCVAFPLALVEDPAGRRRRPRYGALGDFRLQPHGFEYRTPPSWLVSPMAAQAAFALSLLGVRELWALSAAYGTLPAERPELIAAYYGGDRERLYEGMRSFLDLIARTASYRELGRYIAPLLAAIRSGATWDEQTDLRHKWKLPPEAMR